MIEEEKEVYNRKAAAAEAEEGALENSETFFEVEIESGLSVKDELKQMDKEERVWQAYGDMKDAEDSLGTRFLSRIDPQYMMQFLERIYNSS